LDDFVWKNGPYRESSFATAAADGQNTPIPSNAETNEAPEIVINEELLMQRTQLLAELIEIE